MSDAKQPNQPTRCPNCRAGDSGGPVSRWRRYELGAPKEDSFMFAIVETTDGLVAELDLFECQECGAVSTMARR